VDEVIRAIPLWLLREYMVEGGGTASSETEVTGAGWTARLTQVDDFRVGNLAVGQVRVEIDGEPDAVARIEAFLAPKLLRAGG
jgi:hypothetical protein